MPIVITPSYEQEIFSQFSVESRTQWGLTITNSHRQLANPRSPSRLPRIPAASRPPNIFARAFPE